MTNDEQNEEREPHYEFLLDNLMEIHERIAEIRPGMIVSVQFGDRLKRPVGEVAGFNDSFDDVFNDSFHDTFQDFDDAFNDASFRDYFPNGPHFDNVFDKAGDGWIDVHGIDLDLGGIEVVLPQIKELRQSKKDG